MKRKREDDQTILSNMRSSQVVSLHAKQLLSSKSINPSMSLCTSSVLLSFHKRIPLLVNGLCDICLGLCHTCRFKREEIGIAAKLCLKCAQLIRHVEDRAVIKIDEEEGRENPLFPLTSYFKENDEVEGEENEKEKLLVFKTPDGEILENSHEIQRWLAINVKPKLSSTAVKIKAEQSKALVNSHCQILWQKSYQALLEGKSSNSQIIRFLRRMIKIDKRHEEFLILELVSFMIEKGEAKQAYESIFPFISIPPFSLNPQIHYLAGLSCLEQLKSIRDRNNLDMESKVLQKGILHSQKALDMKSSDEKILIQLVELYVSSGELNNAEVSFEKFLKRNPLSVFALTEYVLFIEKYQSKNNKKRKELLFLLHKIDPTSSISLANLSELYSKRVITHLELINIIADKIEYGYLVSLKEQLNLWKKFFEAISLEKSDLILEGKDWWLSTILFNTENCVEVESISKIEIEIIEYQKKSIQVILQKKKAKMFIEKIEKFFLIANNNDNISS